MKTLLIALVVLALAAPIFAASQTWKNVTLIDSNCAAKMKNNPDAHTRECALQCAGSGLGILTSDGTFLKFDANGQKEALAALKTSNKADHLRATVTGEKMGGMIHVQSLKLD
jgi:hypothetical protein